MVEFENQGTKAKKSFWKRPEGVTGAIVLAGLIGGGGYLLYKILPALLERALTVLQLTMVAIPILILLYIALDPKARNLVWYMYKSIMRTITGWFVQIDPIGILKSYIEDLSANLVKMRKQIGSIKGQMRKLTTLIEDNNKEINSQMKLASAAKAKGMDNQVILSSRKAARLKESNEKYQVLLNKMEVLYRILNKMHQNSEILLEDTKDQVKLKEQERKIIRTSHSAMMSARNVISGDPDKRAMFDAAMESIADDVANKVGEMERFMDMSANFMDTIDLQNGVFEEEGLAMLEKWEKESTLLLLDGNSAENTLDLDSPHAEPQTRQNKRSGDNDYSNLFN